MRTLLVQRVALALTLLLAAASLGFAWSVQAPSRRVGARASSERSGAESFRQACTRCHDAEELALQQRTSKEPVRAALELLRFLEGHGSTDASEDRAIVEYLAGLEAPQ